jgi:hypothetical protein
MSNEDQLSTEELIPQRIRFFLRKGTFQKFSADCRREMRKPHEMVAFILERFYEGQGERTE